jgi:hypothetical protein
MAQYIRTPCDPDFNNVNQVTQCCYHEERVFEIFYDTQAQRPLIQNNGEYFLLHSPDIDNITIYNVLEALGYAHEQIVITWTEDGQNDALLNSSVQNAALSQLSIYSPNQPIPENMYLGPLPMIAGHPIPAEHPNAEPDFGPFQNAPAPADPAAPAAGNDDNNTELSDMPSYRIVDRFDDSDNDRNYD